MPEKTEINRMSFIRRISLFILVLSLASCEKEEDSLKPIELQAEIEHVSVAGGSDGAINLTVTGGIPPYTFLWSNSETTEDIEAITSGQYSVLVTDSENHTRADTFDVTQPMQIIINFSVKDPSYTGAEDGEVTTTIEGDNPPYSFFWSNGATTQNIENLQAGSYVLTVTNNSGQEASDSVKLIDYVVDVQGNRYNTVKIGDQIWMKENLRVSVAPDSTPITSYIYANDTANLAVYGRLYTWDVAMNYSSEEKAQGICPEGWHIPSDEEFKILEMHLGMTQEQADLANTWRGATIGTQLKQGGSSGFDAQLSGRRTSYGMFSLLGRVEYLWTSSEHGENYAWRRCLDRYANDVGRWNTFPKSYAFSVRCLKDDSE